MSWAAIGSAAIAAGGSYLSAKNNKPSGSTTSTQNLSPQFQAGLWGNGSPNRPGLLNQILDQAMQPQNGDMKNFGSQFQAWLGQNGYNDWTKSNAAAQGLQGSNISAPQMQAATAQAPQAQWSPAQAAQGQPGQVPQAANSWNSAAQINAPSQNGTNLSPAFNQMIYGDAGNNPYLTGAIQSGMDQSREAFKAMQADATENLTENILPSIRSGAIGNGTFGGSRQALHENKAVDNFSEEMAKAATNFGNANTGAALGVQSQAFNQGQDRALSAMGNLNQNQFGTAAQNAGFQQQSGLQNTNNMLQNGQFNSSLLQQMLMQNLGNQQQANMATAGYQNQNSQFNAGLQQQTGLANAGWQNAANQNNQQAQQSTNALNSANQATGIGLSNQLQGQGYNFAQSQNNSYLDQLGKIAGLISPFSGTGVSQTQPYYTNSAGNALGGASAALGLYNQFAGLGGGGAQDARNNWSGATGPGSNFMVGGSGSGGMFNVSPGSAGDTSWLSNFGF